MSDRFSFVDVKIKKKYKCMCCGRIKIFTFDKKCNETKGLWISKTNTPSMPYMECPRCKKILMVEEKNE